jgi:hypothetical protein
MFYHRVGIRREAGVSLFFSVYDKNEKGNNREGAVQLRKQVKIILG